MSTKQQIYAEILTHGISLIRNRHSDAALCLTVADFLHNIPMCMLSEDFAENDFYFLNLEVPGYLSYCQHNQIQPSPTLLALAAKLKDQVPETLKHNVKQSSDGT